MNLIPGKLYKFQRINGHTAHLNNKLVMYLGEAHIHRDDGVVVKNFRIHVVGADHPATCDNGLRRWLQEAT